MNVTGINKYINILYKCINYTYTGNKLSEVIMGKTFQCIDGLSKLCKYFTYSWIPLGKSFSHVYNKEIKLF